MYMLSDDDTILNFSIWKAEAGVTWNLPLTPNFCGPVLQDIGKIFFLVYINSFLCRHKHKHDIKLAN
jgi:hypothetical protein